MSIHRLSPAQVAKAAEAKTPGDYRRHDNDVAGAKPCGKYQPFHPADEAHMRGRGDHHTADKCVVCGYPKRLHKESI